MSLHLSVYQCVLEVFKNYTMLFQHDELLIHNAEQHQFVRTFFHFLLNLMFCQLLQEARTCSSWPLNKKARFIKSWSTLGGEPHTFWRKTQTVLLIKIFWRKHVKHIYFHTLILQLLPLHPQPYLKLILALRLWFVMSYQIREMISMKKKLGCILAMAVT